MPPSAGAPPPPPAPPAPPPPPPLPPRPPPAGQAMVISSLERPRARCSRPSDTLGRPSGKRSPVQVGVYSIVCCLVHVHNWACAGAGASIGTAHVPRASAIQ